MSHTLVEQLGAANTIRALFEGTALAKEADANFLAHWTPQVAAELLDLVIAQEKALLAGSRLIEAQTRRFELSDALLDAYRVAAVRYAYVSTLDPLQFAELFQRSLAGEDFGELVDEALGEVRQ